MIDSMTRAALGALALTLVVACGDSNSPVSTSPLEGYSQVGTSDTGTVKPPPPPVGPGSFHGVVRGYQSGIIDTLGTAVLLEGVTVNAYTRVASAPDEVGVLAASVLTNASGVFQMPTLAGGEYVVTFTPPASSPYKGGWTLAFAGPQSNENPWWIMLPKK
jgi:hypothetical protein